jgi:spermidine/putrescine transport system substrate-binding protein
MRILTWEDYLSPELVRQFEREQQCRVVVETFRSNEELLVILESPRGDFDLVTPSSYMVRRFVSAGLLQPLDLERVENRDRVDRLHLEESEDAGMVYSVPFQVSHTGIASLAEFSGSISSWEVFMADSNRGAFTLLDDVREVVGGALRAVGASANSVDAGEISKALEVGLAWMDRISRLDRSRYRALLEMGEVKLAQAFSGDVASLLRDGRARFEFPREGSFYSCDDFCIPARAKQSDLAHRFISFMHYPAFAAENMEWSGYRIPNPDAVRLLSASTLANPAIFPTALARKSMERLRDVEGGPLVWEKAWNTLTARIVKSISE